LAQGSNE